MFRLLQKVLFKTDYIFDASMASIGGYEPWKCWNKVDSTPIQIKNEFTTVPKMVIYFLILTEVMRFSVEFCVVKFSSFG